MEDTNRILKPDKYGRIGFKYEVIDVSLQEGKNVIWIKFTTEEKQLSLKVTPLYENDKFV